MPQPASVLPQSIPGTLAVVQRVFDFTNTGWVVAPGISASVPGVVRGMPDVSIGQGKVVLRFSLSLGGFSIPARVEIGPTTSSFIIDPALRLQLSYEVPYWETIMQLLCGKETPIAGTSYSMKLPVVSATSPVMPAVSLVPGSSKIQLTFPSPYPKIGSGLLWAYVRGAVLDPQGCTLDLYRPLLGFDLAKNPRFLWA